MPRTGFLQVPICVSCDCLANHSVAQETLCSMAFADRASRATLGAESAQEAIRPPRCFPSGSSSSHLRVFSVKPGAAGASPGCSPGFACSAADGH